MSIRLIVSFVLFALSMSYSQSVYYALTKEQSSRVNKFGLSKTSIGPVRSDTFVSSYNNLLFIPPTGWQYNVYFDTKGMTFLQAFNTSLSAKVGIISYTDSLPLEAEYHNGSGAFNDLYWCFDRMSKNAPLLTYVLDTNVSTTRYCFSKCKYLDTYDSLRASKGFSSGNTYIKTYYVTSSLDDLANSARYDMVYKNTYFAGNTGSIVGLTKRHIDVANAGKLLKLNIDNQRGSNLAVDLIGRDLRSAANGVIILK